MKELDIDDCILKMQEIVDWSVENNSHLGYFAILYQTVTIRVNQEIISKRFKNNDEIELMVTNFAKRYLTAINEYFESKKSVTKTWDSSFNLENPKSYSILQHLMLGMNAHIIFDLAISSAAVAPDEKIFEFKEDFFIINEILISMIDEIQNMISKVFWMMKPLDYLLGNLDEKIAAGIIVFARNKAWDLARLLALSNDKFKPILIEEMDNEAHFITEKILSPKGVFKIVLGISNLFESNNITNNLKQMKFYQEKVILQHG